MSVIRFILKLVLLQLLLIVTLIEWAGALLTSFEGAILFILSSIIFLIAITGRIVVNEPWSEVLKLIGLSFGISLVGIIGDWLVERIGSLASCMRRFIRS